MLLLISNRLHLLSQYATPSDKTRWRGNAMIPGLSG